MLFKRVTKLIHRDCRTTAAPFNYEGWLVTTIPKNVFLSNADNPLDGKTWFWFGLFAHAVADG